MTTTTKYAHPKHQRTVDGGLSGPLVVTNADSSEGATLVFVDSEWLSANLVLTPGQAWELGYALTDPARLAGHFGETAQPPVVMLSHAETAERETGPSA